MTKHFSNRPERDRPPLPVDTHLVVDGQVLGPLAPDELIRLATEQRIGAATLAWHPALDVWSEIGRLPELAWILEAPALRPAVELPPILAGFGARFAGGAADMTFWLAIVAAGAAALGYWPWLIGASDDPRIAARIDVLAQIAAAVYFILPMSRIGGGATLGYRLLGLRLVAQENLRPPDLLRTFVWYIVSYARFIGWLTSFIDSKRRMLHNLASRTIVIVARDTFR